MDRGPVTEDYGADPAKVVAILNEVLATEIVCWMRYTRHAITATGINRAQVSGEFTEHAEEERGHASGSPSGSASLAATSTSIRPRWPPARIPPTRRSP